MTEQGTKSNLREAGVTWASPPDHPRQLTPTNSQQDSLEFLRHFQDALCSWTTTQRLPPSSCWQGRAQSTKTGLCRPYLDAFSPFLHLLLIRVLPCSQDTDSALLPARNEDKVPPLRANATHFCKQAGENFTGDLWRQHPWEGPDNYWWFHHSPRDLLPLQATFSSTYFLHVACILIHWQKGGKWKLKQQSSIFPLLGPPWGCHCSIAWSYLLPHYLFIKPNGSGREWTAVDRKSQDDISLIFTQSISHPYPEQFWTKKNQNNAK